MKKHAVSMLRTIPEKSSRPARPAEIIWKHRVIIMFLLLLLFSLSSCTHEEKFKEYPVFYDFIENFHLAEVQQEVKLIDFGTPSARQFMKSGWSMNEGTDNANFVWGIGEKSVLEFLLYKPRDILVTFRCSPLQFPGSPVQTISISVNGKELETFKLQAISSEYEIVLPRAVVVAGMNRLEFRYTYARAPAEISQESTDVRLLAVAWDYLHFGVTTDEERDGGISKAHAGAENSLLYIPFGAKVDYYFVLPGESIFTFEGLTLMEEPQGLLRLVLQREGEEEQLVGNFLPSSEFQAIPLPGDLPQIIRLSFQAVSAKQRASGSDVVKVMLPAIRAKKSQKKTLTESSSRQSPSYGNIKKSNIIIYLIDALRADHLGCYGYDKPISPNIDAFARAAILFEKAFAQAPYTRSATASLFTGLYPTTHRVNRRFDALSPETTTMAELLHAEGYYTAAFMVNGNTTKAFGFDQGFVDFVDVTSPRKMSVRGKQLHDAHKEKAHHEFSAPINEYIYEWLDNNSNKQPFFLYLHTMEPHSPYNSPRKFLEKFAATVREPEVSSEVKVLLANLKKAFGRTNTYSMETKIGSIPWMQALYTEKIQITETLMRTRIHI